MPDGSEVTIRALIDVCPLIRVVNSTNFGPRGHEECKNANFLWCFSRVLGILAISPIA